jgi:hypothetical protein
MARKRRKVVSDDLKIPDFDEKGYLKLEMRGSIFAVACVGMGLLMSIIAGFLTWGTHDGRIAFVLGVLGFFLVLLLLNVFKVDTEGFDKMRWAGGFVTYMLTFVAIWILLINPPLAYLVPPKITNNTTADQELGSIVSVEAYVDDTQGIKSVDVVLTDPKGQQTGPFGMSKVVQNLYAYDLENPMVGTYSFIVEVKDQGGFYKNAKYQFNVKENKAPTIDLWNFTQNQTVVAGQKISAEIKDNVGVILAFYGVDQPSGFETLPSSSESKLTIDNQKDSLVTIPTKNWSPGQHTLTICAMDRVPHRETCNSYKFVIV